jgi:membrane-associated phospholipid phosphatase
MGTTQHGSGGKAFVAARSSERAAAPVRQIAARPSIGALSFARAILGPCGAFEWVALLYLALTGALMVVFHRNLARPVFYIAAHFAVFAAILLVVNVADRVGRGERSHSGIARTLRWIRDWYPQTVFLFCFEELEILVRLIVRTWRDPVLIALDHRLTGVYPAVWLVRFSSIWLNEAMEVAYLSYFPFLTIVGALIYRRRNVRADARPSRDPSGAEAMRAFWTVMTASIVAYSIGYMISIFFPVEAPYFAMRSFDLLPLASGPASHVASFIEGWGRVRGGAFPSAHVSGSFVALFGTWRYRRNWFWVFLPGFVAMCMSTIYCRYHYIADVFAGILVGAVGFILAERLMKLPGANPAERVSPPQ